MARAVEEEVEAEVLVPLSALEHRLVLNLRRTPLVELRLRGRMMIGMGMLV